MRLSLLAAFTAALLVALLAPGAAAKTVDLTVEAREGDCPRGTYCFVVTSGAAEDIAPGDTVDVRFVNTGDTVHEFLAAPLADADDGHTNTPESVAIAESQENMAPGAEDNVTFTAPEGDGLYFWCGVSGHESLGMWLEVSYAEAGDGEDTPLPAWLPAAAALLVALFRRGGR